MPGRQPKARPSKRAPSTDSASCWSEGSWEPSCSLEEPHVCGNSSAGSSDLPLSAASSMARSSCVRVSSGLSGGCFDRAGRGVLRETAAGIVDRDEATAIPVVLDELERTGRIEEADGKAAVFELAATPSYASSGRPSRDAVAGGRPVLKALVGLAKSFIRPRLAGSLLLFLATVGVLCVAGAHVGIWDPGLTTKTVFWTFGAGIILFSEMKQAGDPVFFKNAAARVLGATALLAFYVNMFVFDLYVELLIQPFILLLLMMSASAESRSDLAQVKRLTDWTLGLVGVGITVYVTMRLARNWNDIDHSETLRALFLPVWLTLGILPLIYLLALLSAYRVTLVGAMSSLDRRAVPWRVRLAIITSFHVRLAELESLNWGSLREIAAAQSLGEARQRIGEVRQKQRSAAAEERAKLDRLERFAGVSGTDADGRRRDQREFDETRIALERLATMQMGWYRYRGERYRTELVERLDTRFEKIGLPEPRGIEIQVSQEGQSWYAWRRTITGWHFAIGSAGPPPDQWLYDGPEPPTGFPCSTPGWHRPGTETTNW